MISDTVHHSVLLEEVSDFLCPTSEDSPTLFLDGTLGGAGHSEAMLQRHRALFLIGLDRDPMAIERCERRLAPFTGRYCLREANFSETEDVLRSLRPTDLPPVISDSPVRVDRALLDLGLSSDQLADPARGFSFQADGPLDMRMSGAQGPSAADLLNSLEPRELRVLFLRGGVSPIAAHALARAVVRARPITTTGALSQLCHDSLPARERGKGRHPATVPFQALRMAVNDELGAIERFLDGALRWLAPNGRLAIIAFHSSEDRLVTRTMRRWSQVQHRSDGSFAIGTLLTKKAVVPTEEEVRLNPRSRSARLRVFQRSDSAMETREV